MNLLHTAAMLAVVCWALLQHSTDAKLALRWAEEFKPCSSSSTCVNGGINTTRWGFELGDGRDYGESLIGWGNWQRQCHTSSPDNVRVETIPGSPQDGMLVIQGLYHPGGRPCQNARVGPGNTEYTSARLVSRGKAAFRWTGEAGNASVPIRIDVRLRFPLANGTWPAVFMLPDTNKPWCLGCGPYGNGWCLGGELDIMEHVNTRNTAIGNMHFGGRPDASWLDCKNTPGTAKLSSPGNWQVFSMVWDSTSVKFLANDRLVKEVKMGEWSTGGAPNNPYAPFDVPFFFNIDMAIGGLYPGFNIDNSKAPFRFMIDYIRVYDVLP